MKKKISNIYRIANKCGFDVKHRCTEEQPDEITGIKLNNVSFAFKDKCSKLDGFFVVNVPNVDDLKTFRDNVAHAVFLISEDFDPHTETQKYLEKKGFTLQQYDEINSKMTALAWQIRKLWFSL